MSNLAEFTDAAHVAEQRAARIVTPAIVTRRAVSFTAPELISALTVSRNTRIADMRDAFSMTEMERNLRHAKGFCRLYTRGHFERAFRGVDAQGVREVGGDK
jgi:hypothetical protein